MLLKLIFLITENKKTKNLFFMLLFDESLVCKLCCCVAYLAHLNDKVEIIVDAFVLMVYDKCDRLCCYVLHSVEVVLLKTKIYKKANFCHIFIINFRDYRLGSHFLDINYAKSLRS